MTSPTHSTAFEVLGAMLGVPVPESYQQFIASVPDALSDAVYEGTSTRIAERELFADLERVVAKNRAVRESPVWGGEGESWWTRAHFVIGADLSGDIVFLDAGTGDASVLRYVVENGKTIRMADDVISFARRLVANDPTLPRS